MPVSLQVDRARRMVTSTFYGQVTNEEFMRQASLIQSHPDSDPHFSEIIDFTGVTTTNLSTETIWAAATTTTGHTLVVVFPSVLFQPYEPGPNRRFLLSFCRPRGAMQLYVSSCRT